MSLDAIVNRNHRLKEFKEYWGDNITNKIYEDYISNPHKDYVLENLQTHDSEFLKGQILKRYWNHVTDIKSYSKSNKSEQILILYVENPNDMYFLFRMMNLRICWIFTDIS